LAELINRLAGVEDIFMRHVVMTCIGKLVQNTAVHYLLIDPNDTEVLGAKYEDNVLYIYARRPDNVWLYVYPFYYNEVQLSESASISTPVTFSAKAVMPAWLYEWYKKDLEEKIKKAIEQHAKKEEVGHGEGGEGG